MRDSPARAPRFRRSPGRIRVAGRVTAGRPGLEEGPDTTGQDAPGREGAKADGQWHRKQTADSASPETLTVRVKRWGKSPPAAVATSPARQTPSGARRTGSAEAARRGAG